MKRARNRAVQTKGEETERKEKNVFSTRRPLRRNVCEISLMVQSS